MKYTQITEIQNTYPVESSPDWAKDNKTMTSCGEITGGGIYVTSASPKFNLVACTLGDTIEYVRETFTYGIKWAAEEINEIESDIEKIFEDYNLINPDEIKIFLEQNTFLYEIIKLTPKKIKEYFPNSNLYLEIKSDIEIDSMKKLIVLIENDMELEEGKETLDTFYDDWWFDASLKTKAKMCIFYK